MNICIFSNAPWVASGYGTQTNILANELDTKTDHNVFILCNYGFHRGTIDTGNRIKILSALFENNAIKDVLFYHNKYHFDVILTLCDVWAFPGLYSIDLPFAAWVPIDQEPIANCNLQILKQVFKVIAMSDYYNDILNKEGVDSVYIPHSVDTKIFKPLPAEERREAKTVIGFDPDTFVMGFVAMNKGMRKAFPEQLAGCKKFIDMYPGKKFAIYLHTITDSSHGGLDLTYYCRQLGLDCVRASDKFEVQSGVDLERMNVLYNAFDVTMQCTRAEGFGIPVIESFSAGTPVIGSNFSSMRTLINSGTGLLVEPISLEWTPIGAYQCIPNPDEIANALNAMYIGDRSKYPDQCRNYAVKHFDTDVVTKEKWIPFFEDLKQSFESPDRICKDLRRFYK